VKKFSTVEIIKQELESVENEPQVNNESLHVNIEQSAEPLIDELMKEAMVNQSTVESEEFGSWRSNWESVTSETSEVSIRETTPARGSERVRIAPTSYREKREYKKKKKLNSPTQEKRIQKQEKKKT
jgi:hypothetical protein